MKKVIKLLFVVMLLIMTGCRVEEPSLIVDDYQVEVEIGEKLLIVPQVKNYREQPVFEYLSSETSVFTIDEENQITPINSGIAFLVIKLVGTAAFVSIEVRVLEQLELSFPNESYTMKVGDAFRLELITSSKIYLDDIVWKTSEDIVSIDATGIITAKAAGTTTITARVRGVEASVNIVINKQEEEPITPPDDDPITPPDDSVKPLISIIGPDTIEINESASLSVVDNNDSPIDVTWESDNEEVVRIIMNRFIMGVTEGIATLTATSIDNPELTTQITITVTIPKLEVSVYPSPTMIVGTKTHSFIVKTSKGTAIRNYNCIFESSDPDIVSISSEGVITSLGVGEVTITVRANNGIGTINLTITKPPIENLRNKLVWIAILEDGYREGPNNDTKYGDWYGFSNQPWCAMFVSWCANQAGISFSIIPRYAAVSEGLAWYKQKGSDHYKSFEETVAGTYTPICGDIVFFKSNGASHTGIVVKVVGDKLYTIEGNTSDRVALKWYYYKTYDKITGYGVPDYPASSSPIEDFDVTLATYGGGSPTT